MYGVAGVEHYSNLLSIKSTDVFVYLLHEQWNLRFIRGLWVKKLVSILCAVSDFGSLLRFKRVSSGQGTLIHGTRKI